MLHKLNLATMQSARRSAMLALLFAALLSIPASAQQGTALLKAPPTIAPADAPSTIAMTTATEPGERLIVTGIVTDASGDPVRGVSIYIYHTDASGHYDPNEPADQQGYPRLTGYMRTDAGGHYKYTTIRPAPYPSRTIPAHVHFNVVAPGNYGIVRGELRFTDDPLLTDQARAETAKWPASFPMCQPSKDVQGAWHCTHDIVLKTN